MKNQFDGGEAIVEAFCRSHGTEWAPVWEAMADQIADEIRCGPMRII
jgi:hypothetical protein